MNSLNVERLRWVSMRAISPTEQSGEEGYLIPVSIHAQNEFHGGPSLLKCSTSLKVKPRLLDGG